MKSLLFIILIAFITSKRYTVKPGDTLTSIASKHNVKVSDLVSWNKIQNPDKIDVGLKIIVSKKEKKEHTSKTDQPVKPENPTDKTKRKDDKKDHTKKQENPTDKTKRKGGKTKTYVTAEQMKKMGFSNCNIKDLNRCLKKYDITTSKRIRHFIAQCSHESALGRYTEELGGQSHCSKYDGRKDLGNTQKGDGCKYKGAGFIQLTGKYNYQEFAKSIGDNKVMEGVSYVAKNYPWSSAAFWWKSNKMNELCDKGASVEVITKRVNGGYNGLSERKKYYDKASTIF